jgi:uncharacterized membrane protein YdjX (TVP38/TMEM64 family)
MYFSFLVIIIVICLFDSKLVLKLFNEFISWVKLHPYQSIGYTIYVLTFSVVFTLPISYTIVMLSYTYSQVFNSNFYGFAFTVPIVYVGSMSGALVTFIISRYLFKGLIKE